MPYKQLNSPYLRERFGLEINPRVFLPSAGLILLFVLLGIFFSGRMESTLGAVQAGVARNAGWVLITVVNGVLGFAIYLLFSRFGRIRLGGPEAEPEFSTFAWLAMLFSAGMGIGLVFWSVAEPISHYAAPPLGEPLTVDAAREAMRFTFYHWGLHPWAIYAIVGLALAFFSYNRGLPLTVRSVFYPLLGRRIYGPFGHAIDAVAVVATLFGVATSLGFGVQQVSTGLSHFFGVTKGPVLNIVLIAAITGMATVSVVTGLDAGIRRISEINLGFAGLLMLFVLIMGPTLFIVNGLIQNIGSYLHYLPRMSTWTEAYSDRGWQNSWTTFYWGWWIAWAPFVGMFIAQISRGRTIREFLLGVILMPTALTFLWLTVFGRQRPVSGTGRLRRDGGGRGGRREQGAVRSS